MAFPTYHSTTTTSKSSLDTTTFNVNLPTTVAGDLLILLIAAHEARETPDQWTTPENGPIVPPSGFTLLHHEQMTGNDTDDHWVYAKIATGSEGSTIAATLQGGAGVGPDGAVAHVLRFAAGSWSEKSLSNNDIALATATTHGIDSTPNPPALNPFWGTADISWWACVLGTADDETVSSYPTNFANGQTSTVSGAGAAAGATIGSAGNNHATSTKSLQTYTMSASIQALELTFAIRPVITKNLTQTKFRVFKGPA